MEKKSFTCFYPSRPFWAVSPVNFDENQLEDSWFTSQMSEQVYIKTDEVGEIRVCRDGCILIRIVQLEAFAKNPQSIVSISSIQETISRWSRYLDYLNTLYLLLDSATIRIDKKAIFNLHEITIRDGFRVGCEDNIIAISNIVSESHAHILQMGRYLSNYRSTIPITLDPRIFGRNSRVVSKEAIDCACNNFMELSKNEEFVIKVAALAKSLAAYKVGNYQISILLSWFVIESLLGTMWSQLLRTKNIDYPNGKKRINSDRMNYFNGRDFPISTVSNLLELEGLLDHSSFEKIDQVRGYRNKIVHGGNFKPEDSHAQLALKVANEMINSITQIEITLNYSYSVSGI